MKSELALHVLYLIFPIFHLSFIVFAFVSITITIPIGSLSCFLPIKTT